MMRTVPSAPELPSSLSKKRVNVCGDRLLQYIEGHPLAMTEEELLAEIAIVIQWRRQHAYPLRLAMPSLRN
jgi:hypothetical protein